MWESYRMKVIIVEDERIIRTGIKNCVDWKALGIDEVATAANAEEAQDIMEKENFQIVISDICMPGMNGIELCRYYLEKNPESQIIFISGYSDKEYLISAISLGAVSYVEKPISIVALTDALKKAISHLNQISRANSSVIHYLLHTNEGQILTGDENRSFLPKEADRFCACILRLRKNTGDNRGYAKRCEENLRKLTNGLVNLVLEPMSGRFFAGLLCWNSKRPVREADLYRTGAGALLSTDGFVSFGRTVDRLEAYHVSHEDAEDKQKLLASKGWGNYAEPAETYEEYTGSLSKEEREEFWNLLMKKEEASAVVFVKRMIGQFISRHCVMNYYVRNTCFDLERLIMQAYRSIHLNGVAPGIQEHEEVLAEGDTLEEMSSQLQEHIREILSETEMEQNNNYLIRNAVLYINEHAMESSLNVKSIADSVYVSQSYLSNLFKKKMGITVGQYILDLRIKAAKQYLKDPQYKLYQIAQLVGYSDANYFAKLFKKKTGKLPSEYRGENRIDE